MTDDTRTTTTTALAETPEGATPPSEPTSPVRTRRVRILSSILFASVALAGILLVLYAWRLPPFSSAIESTENALVRGQVTIIGPQLSGYVVDVPVHDFQFVKAGDLLVQLDDRIYKQRLAQAIAQLQQQQAALANNLQQRNSADATIAQRHAAIGDATAQADKARADLRRSQALVSDGSVSRSDFDLARASQAAAVANLAQAKAALADQPDARHLRPGMSVVVSIDTLIDGQAK